VAVWFDHIGGYRAPPLVKIIAVGTGMSNKFLHRCFLLRQWQSSFTYNNLTLAPLDRPHDQLWKSLSIRDLMQVKQLQNLEIELRLGAV
jgi:hypothetical protein